jgi:hypothetical protein
MTTVINEFTTEPIIVTFKDEDGDPITPTSAKWRVDDVRSGTEVRAWTVLTVASIITLQLLAADTTILNVNNHTEEREVTVSAEFTGNKRQTLTVNYEIRNLRFLTT